MDDQFESLNRQVSFDYSNKEYVIIFIVSTLLLYFNIINLVLLISIDYSYLRQLNLDLFYLILIPLSIDTLLISYHYYWVTDMNKVCSYHIRENNIENLINRFLLGVFIISTFASYIFIILIWRDHFNQSILFTEGFWSQLVINDNLNKHGIIISARDYWKYNTLDIMIRIYSSILLLVPISLGCLLIIIAICSIILIKLGE